LGAKVFLYNMWNALFVSVDIPSLRFLTIDTGMHSMEHLEVTSNHLRKVVVNGNNVLRTFIGYAQNRKIEKPDNLKFGSNNIKGPKQDSKNRLSHICLREENLSFINKYII
jgi:hypothetical protein